MDRRSRPGPEPTTLEAVGDQWRYALVVVQAGDDGRHDRTAEGRDGVPGEGAARGSGERCDQQGLERSPNRPKVFHYFQHSGWPLLTL